MQDDDFPDDDTSAFSDPLHPDDRLWRHPSEMRSVPPVGSRSIPDNVDFAPPIPRRRLAWGVVVASSLVGASAALLAVVATGMGGRVVERIVEPPSTSVPDSIVTVSTTAPVQGAAEAVAAVMPAVAHVTVTGPDATIDASAVVIRADGYLVTGAAAVGSAETITVSFADGSTEAGEVVAVDPLSEIAVIHVARRDLTVVEFGDPSALQVGQQAMALGSHQDGGPSISSGVISALDQRSTGETGNPLYGMIRFDAPVPTEIAGGPLVTDTGAIVGITVRSAADSLFGWATPIDEAREIAEELIATGHATHAWLGVEGRRTADGPVVSVVVEGSPAAEAGLRVDDVLVSVEGEPLASMAVLASIIRGREPGETITITYRRNGLEWTCVATLGERS